jgi:hypothetical protein
MVAGHENLSQFGIIFERKAAHRYVGYRHRHS